ncbi:MAG TPA: DNA polymerase I [Candidatus Stercorousia faecigallinarum]|nr:DNA polymerase I [Candidatus Stercorousia faecigallinarum]
MSNNKTLILIDGHALAFRQYYALERSNMRTSDGTPTWAVYGFFKAVFDLLKNSDLNADAIAVAFDVSHHTFRTDTYSDYKCNREAMPDNMRSQMNLIYDGLKAFNIPVYTKEGFEADDVIGTISKKACELGHRVLILTGDQDAFQLVDKDGCVKVILPSKGELIEYNWDRIFEKLGVYPDQVIDYKGLRGDVSDCIPGVKGIGEKTAQKLLAKYGTLDAVLADCENIPEKSVREKICAGKEQAKMSQYLATIVRDVDIDFDFDKAKVDLPEVAVVTDFLKKMQFYTFIKNINEIMYSFDKINRNEPAYMPSDGSLQLGFFADAVNEEINKNSDFKFEKKLITDSSDLSEMVAELQKHSLIAFNIYADVRSAVSSLVTGFSFACSAELSADGHIHFSGGSSDTKTFYVPINHSNIENQLRLPDVISELKPLFENESVYKTTHNAKTAFNILRCLDVCANGIIFDTALASYVKDPQRNHELDIQAMEHLNHAVVQYSPFEKNKKKQIHFADAPSDTILNYAADEISTVVELTKFWINNLDEKELELTYNVEVPLTFVLADMEYTGVSVDENYLYRLTVSMNNQLSKIEGKIYELAGQVFNINSPRQVGEVLFERMGLKAKKKRGKTNYSTNAAVLEELAEDYEIAKLILDYRKFSKLKSTYTEALPALIDRTDKRIHTTYNQTVTATGRLSSSNPNLQNIPIRTEEGNKIRNAFVAGDRVNGLILSADYSQIELRLLAHITQDKHLLEAFNSGIDVHTLTASKVFDVPVAKVTKEMRYKSKAVNFGIIYGQSKYGLAKALGISNAEAETFIEKYFATYPRVKAYMEGTVMQAEEKGYVETIFGRKRYLATELSSSNGMIREFAKRAAINQPMQGTAADLMKIAMIDFSKKLKENNLQSKMIMQVHDELVVEVVKSELDIVTKLVKEAMELNQPLSVPLVVDVNVGESWKEQ